MQTTSMGIRPRILLPFTLVMLILIVGFGLIFFQFQVSEIETQAADQSYRVNSLLQSQIEQEAALMVSQLSFLTGNTALQNAYMSQDRDVLLGHATPIFMRLRDDSLVTHFYFTGLDRVNFLRVHNPPKLGDTIGRHTTLEAERTGDIAYGVELGASGMFTLRVVTPWNVNDERIGYMELGMEIDHIISRIHEDIEAELVVLIEKEYVNQENWQQSMQVLGRSADWDLYDDVVLIDSTLANVERVVDDETVTLVSTTDDANFNVTIDDRRLSAHNVPLLSANGEEVGELIVFSDITEVTDNLMTTSLNAALIAVMVFIVAFAFLYIYVGTISRRQSDLIESLQVVNAELETQATVSEDQVRQLEAMNVEIQERATVEQSQHQALLNLAVEVRDAVQVLNEAAMEIQASATQQVANITEQDAAVTQTSATVDQVHSTVQKTAERALQVAESAQESVEVSQRGESAVSDTIEGMEMIRRQVNNIAETILSLSEHTQQIGEIIETVSSIADQSKLLSLNASIEAARASEEGRGFAVVAAEVRELAEQSKMATDRISSILSEIQQATNTAVMVTEEGSKGVDRGMTLVNSAGLAIRDLADMVREATHAAVEISNDTRSQIDSVRQLAAAMQQIKEASLQTAASSRQTERSARNLTDTSMRLEQAITEYNID